ncbi:MAG: sigma-70 family RNA polymerase sigma factor [Polyangiaceae bacterium]
MSKDRITVLVSEHYDLLWRTLRRLGVPAADTDDATQDVFIVAARRIDDIEPEKTRAFLMATALRVASTRRRTERRRPLSFEDDLDQRLYVEEDPEALTAELRARRTLDAILDEMPDELRIAFVLFELEELTAPQVAELLSIPVGTVASRVRRAREVFRAAASRARQHLHGEVEP